VLIEITVILLACLCGSLASAVIVCKAMGLSDPRQAGSNNPGATNVLRLHGKKAAALTLAGDVLKGVLPVLAARWLGMDDSIVAASGLAAFTGHLYPVFFGFQGGKGVATLLGVLVATHWLCGLTFAGTWLLMALLFRYSSLAALVASLVTPVASLTLLPAAYAIAQSIMVILVFWRHRSNIRNLVAGREDRIGDKT